jgi:hypothetical protein
LYQSLIAPALKNVVTECYIFLELTPNEEHIYLVLATNYQGVEMNMMRAVLIFSFFALPSLSLAATVYNCQASNGKVLSFEVDGDTRVTQLKYDNQVFLDSTPAQPSASFKNAHVLFSELQSSVLPGPFRLTAALEWNNDQASTPAKIIFMNTMAKPYADIIDLTCKR